MTAVQPATTQGFLFADLRDYTRYAETHGDDAAAALLTAYRRLVRDVVANLGGAEIKTEGDSFYVVFSSASGAVQGGLAILAAAEATNHDPGQPIRVGIGIHAGETAETGEGPVGSAVNIAARVCAEARAGELLVTDTVRSLTRTRLPVRFVARGSRRLKGIAEPITLYQVEPTATATPLQPVRPFRRPVRRWLAPVAGLAAIFFVVVVAAVLLRGSGTEGPGASASSGSPAGASSVGPLVLPELVDVPTYKGDATRRGLQPGPALVTKPVVAWEQPLGAPADGTPIVVDGKVIIATDAGLSAFDARTGAPLWTFRGETGDLKFGGTTPSASAADGLVFAADTSGTFHAVDLLSGVERWAFSKPVNGRTRSIVVDPLVYTGSDDGWAYGLEVATGEESWSWQAPAAITDITVAGGTAYVSVNDSRLYAIDIASRHELWHAPPPVGPGANAGGERTAGVPAIEGDTIYIGMTAPDGAAGPSLLYAVDVGDGSARTWVSPSRTRSGSGAERDDIVYAATDDDGLYALPYQAGDFKEKWHADAPKTVYTGLALVDDVLYLASFDGRLLAYRASTGDELWELPIAEETRNSGPVVTGGMLFQADAGGMLRAYVDPAVAAILPSPAPSPTAGPSPSPTSLPDPFTIVRTIPWSKLGLGTILEYALGPDGFIYVLDTKPEVAVIDPASGKVVRRWGRQGTGEKEFDLTRQDGNPGYGGIAIGPDGLVYVGDGSNHRVQVFERSGAFVRQFNGDGAIGNIFEVEVGPDGGVYVLEEDGHVDKFSAKGQPLWRAGGPQADDPDLRRGLLHGITVRPDGNVIVTCEGCDNFILLDPKTGEVAGRVRGPTGRDLGGLVSVDRAGDIYLVGFGPAVIDIFSPSGKPIARSRDEGFGGPPQFGPNGEGYTFDDDGLVTVEVSLPKP